MNDQKIRESVSEYYGETLQGSDDLKTNACCASDAPPRHVVAALENVHDEVLTRFYGCGFPIPEALDGATVVDLGCGTGRDVFVLAQLVGAGGHVHGIDMTAPQLALAREHLDWHMERFGYDAPNVTLHEGLIEDLSMLADASVDLVVSNCVVNLSPRKDLVLAEVFRVLKPGGEFYFSDVFADRRLPPEIANDPILYGECLGGALYDGDFVSMAKRAGFGDPREVTRVPIELQSDDLADRVGAARFVSATYRLFRLAGLDDQCEDYGQIATYRGTIPESGPLFQLDDHHVFEQGRPERVCGNTASMLADTRFASHFDVVGDRTVHFGRFDCAATMAATAYADSAEGGACC